MDEERSVRNAFDETAGDNTARGSIGQCGFSLRTKDRRKRPQPIAAAGVALKSHPSGTISKLFRLHVVAEQRVHVANVELAVGNYGVRPSLLTTAIWLVKATMLLVAVGA